MSFPIQESERGEPNMTLLKVRDLSVTFETDYVKIHAVRNVSFDIAPGEKVGFLGESGSGKTTTALALMGMIPKPGRISGGTAMMSNTDYLSLSPSGMRAKRMTEVSYIPQGAMNSLNPVQKIKHSILDGMIDHGRAPAKSEANDFVEDLLKRVGLPAVTASRYPHELSGGMKQRVCIALAIALGPNLLIADEPTSALDVITQRQVMETLNMAQEELNSALILIGHDVGLMAQFTDSLMIMHQGQVVEHGKTHEVLKNPQAEYTKKLIFSVPSVPDRCKVEDANDTTRKFKAANTLVEFRNVSKIFGGGMFSKSNTALHPLSMKLSTDRPQIISVVGQSGSGKSTLGNLLLGFYSPSQGQVLYRNHDVRKLDKKGRSNFRREVQAIFQDPYASFNPFYPVDHAFIVPLLRFGIVQSKKQAYEKMAYCLEQVGLEPRAIFGAHSHQLSGGQRQRIMVARALSLEPKLLIADEPVSMVDASLRASILDTIEKLRDENGISVIYITHDLATAYKSADYVMVLHQGRVVEAGLPQSVICDPRHPYSELLVDSIPSPDPDRRWAAGRSLDEDQVGTLVHSKIATAILRNRQDGFQLEFERMDDGF